MSDKHEPSHRQEREHKKEEHAQPTRGMYLRSLHPTWWLVIGVVLIGTATLIWTFALPAFRGGN